MIPDCVDAHLSRLSHQHTPLKNQQPQMPLFENTAGSIPDLQAIHIHTHTHVEKSIICNTPKHATFNNLPF